MRRFYAVIELSDDEWEGTPSDFAVWLEGAMNTVVDADGDEVEATVYTNLPDMLADHALEALSEIPDA